MPPLLKQNRGENTKKCPIPVRVQLRIMCLNHFCVPIGRQRSSCTSVFLLTTNLIQKPHNQSETKTSTNEGRNVTKTLIANVFSFNSIGGCASCHSSSVGYSLCDVIDDFGPLWIWWSVSRAIWSSGYGIRSIDGASPSNRRRKRGVELEFFNLTFILLRVEFLNSSVEFVTFSSKKRFLILKSVVEPLLFHGIGGNKGETAEKPGDRVTESLLPPEKLLPDAKLNGKAVETNTKVHQVCCHTLKYQQTCISKQILIFISYLRLWLDLLPLRGADESVLNKVQKWSFWLRWE